MGLSIGAIIELLNKLNLTQENTHWMEDLPHDIWESLFEDKFKELKSGLYVDKHRWYETSVSVYALADGILGVRSVSGLFSEQMTVDDVFWSLKFFEMEEITTTSYKLK